MIKRTTDTADFGRAIGIYLVLLLVSLAGIFYTLRQGQTLTQTVFASRSSPTAVQTASGPETEQSRTPSTVTSNLARNSAGPLSRLFLQIAAVVGAAWALGKIFEHFSQPMVIGEMVAGILLGPSFFGLIAPRAFEFVFAANSLESLRLFSQLGVCLFMFAVGMELNLREVRQRAPRLLVISHGGILIPFFFGVVLSVYLFERYAGPNTSFIAFALFMGISMSITAFPVLVRILKDRGLFHTPIGHFATICAAMGDVTAWCILAVVVAIASAADLQSAITTLGLVAIYGLIMFGGFRPLLARLLASSLHDEVEPSKGVLALVLGVVLVSSFATEVIGIHALFGAFVAGIVLPAGGGFRRKLILRLEHFASVLLLPLFFAFIGLRTHVGLLSDPGDWSICGLIILVATIGKLGGTAVLARMVKFPWSESLQLGTLMNTRGLMELIVLSIGYDMGILSMRIFTMLVLMAILTTVLTGPMMRLFTPATVRH
jgi:Kef-type K+ transport system membrane component KefB